MKRILKWIGIVLGGLVGLVLVLAVFVTISSQSLLNKRYNIPVEDISIASADLDRGEHLTTMMCAGCHGRDLGGTDVLNEPPLAVVWSSNLTSGEGGAAQTCSDADFERAIRHGIGPDGKGLWVMPATDFNQLSDEDIESIIAYIRSVDPVDHTVPEPVGGPLGRVLLTLNQIPLLPAEKVNHNQPHIASIQPEVTAEYGAYLAPLCTGCHQTDYAGGPLPGAPPDAIPSANLTPDVATGLGTWTNQDFRNAIQMGIKPDGEPIDPSMPWPEFSTTMTTDEIDAIWLYLQTLPPVDTSAETR